MLEEYDRKRDFKITPEPHGRVKSGAAKDLTFVVQKHDARRLHYDFRLEIDGVLVSWAVPKGPSYNPQEKRLAAQTEDHPIDYAQFEGIIPDKQYGAGPVIVWDRGTYSPDEDGKLSWGNRDDAQSRMRDGLKKGKLSFTLRGEKLHGSWTLVRMGASARGKNQWLMIKHKDEFSDPSLDIVVSAERSVISGRTVKEVEDGKKPQSPLLDPEAMEGTRLQPKFPTEYTPQLSTLVEKSFDQAEWIFEPKMDGIRAVAMVHRGKVRLFSRRGLELTSTYPEVVEELTVAAANVGDLILDGEIVALDAKGRPSFQALQQRSGLSRHEDVKNAADKTPIIYYLFDIMRVGRANVEGVVLRDRKALLRQIIVPSEHIKLIDYFAEDGVAAHKAFVDFGLEGTMAKRVDSIYVPGKRTKTWLKIKVTQTTELLICGYTTGSGARNNTFGALLMGYYDDGGNLRYAGNVGTGFNEKLLGKLLTTMNGLRTEKSPFAKTPPAAKKSVWLKPQLVAEVKFAEWTRDGMLRAPVFMRLRDDIKPEDVRKTEAEDTSEATAEAADEMKDQAKTQSSRSKHHLTVVTSNEDQPAKIGKASGQSAESKPRKKSQMNQQAVLDQLTSSKDEKLIVECDGHKISFSSLNKVFWPATEETPALTKRDYAIYLTRVAPHLLTHTTDRPLTLVRFPNGIGGTKFYQKHIEHKLPEYVKPIMLWSEQYRLDHEYISVNNLPTLLWLCQMADLELHTWMSRASAQPEAQHLSLEFTGSEKQLESSVLNFPDYLILDLDPYIYSGKEKQGDEPELNLDAFKKCTEVAYWLKEVLDELKLNAYIKTTGKTGLHIYIPMLRQFDFDQVRNIADVLGRALQQQHPDDVTMEWQTKNRTGKIFYDHNMNARGKTLASIYSPRVVPTAPVSVPVEWKDLDKIYPTDYTMLTVPDHLDKVGDLWADILDHKNDLQALFGEVAHSAPRRRRKS